MEEEAKEPTGASKEKPAGVISAHTLIAVIGFSLYTAWMLLACFWPVSSAQPTSIPATSFQTAVLCGFPLGLLVMAYFVRKPWYDPFYSYNLLTFGLLALLGPLSMALQLLIGGFPAVLCLICAFMTGVVSAFLQVCWLDVLSRFPLRRLGMELGLAVTGGVVVFLLVSTMPMLAQAAASVACVAVSTILVAYGSKNAPETKFRSPAKAVCDRWPFTYEIVPSLFLFGLVFALSFFFLSTHGLILTMIGVAGLLVGAVAIIGLEIAGRAYSITTLQRAITLIAVAACVTMPFSGSELQYVVSFIMAAACAFLVISNSMFLVRKIVNTSKIPVFRGIPRRLAAFALGFAVGWSVAVIVMMLPHLELSTLAYVRMALALALVAAFMVFFPRERHHVEPRKQAAETEPALIHAARTVADPGNVAGTETLAEPVVSLSAASTADAGSPSGKDAEFPENPHEAPEEAWHSSGKPAASSAPSAQPSLTTSSASFSPASSPSPSPHVSETELFNRRCAAIAKLYQLSPREAEILPYLAKGRNNAYLQEKFVISPHTAKSHIYNIYRKLDIHSQQKLMDFVEDFPLD